MGCHWRTSGSTADGCHLVESLSGHLGQGDGRLEEGDEEMLDQLFRRLAIQEGIEESPEVLIVDILEGRRDKTKPIRHSVSGGVILSRGLNLLNCAEP